jgi:hypothetical protein
MLFIIILVAVVMFFIFISDSKTVGGKVPCHETPKKTHTWVLRFGTDENDPRKGYLVCKVCDQVPGAE